MTEAEHLLDDLDHALPGHAGDGRAVLAAVHRLTTRALSSGSDEKRCLKRETATLMDAERLLAVDEGHVGREKQAAVEFVPLVQFDLLYRIDLERLEEPRREPLDFGESPVVGQLEDGGPFVNVSVVNGVLPVAARSPSAVHTR